MVNGRDTEDVAPLFKWPTVVPRIDTIECELRDAKLLCILCQLRYNACVIIGGIVKPESRAW